MIKINMGVVIIFVISPTHRSPNSLGVSRTVTLQEAMATRNLSFEEILEEKPTLDELCEHIRIGSKWYQLGVLLKLNDVKLDDIHRLAEDSTYKTLKMFKLWLGTNPHATRKHVLDALRNEVIEENNITQKYEKILICLLALLVSEQKDLQYLL